jgi:hypothetical protein
MPLNVEAITTYPVEAGKWGVELLAQIIREAGAIALDEAILGAVALSDKIRLARQGRITSEDQAMSARHSPSAAERLCL